MNYFHNQTIAERYAKARPYFHAITMEHIREFLHLSTKLDKALDIACGTGLSTQALLDIAENVYGTDNSAEMLSQALQSDKIIYSLASAENQNFGDNEFDMITVGSGVHWFKIDAFLEEANRILKSKAWMVIYDNFFISEMEYVETFRDWFPNTYLNRFPSPLRNNNYEWTSSNPGLNNFRIIGQEKYTNAVEFSKEDLIAYFTTQSNITNAIENGLYNYQEIEAWLDQELSPFYDEQDLRTVYFGNTIMYLQKKN
jgi:ubiquinone/menaquinone biosynthesis C-methylase UbiE